VLTTPIAFHGDFSHIDFSSLAAILAAIGTLVLAFFTWRLAARTRELANETKEDVRTSKGAAQSSIRPLLVGVPLGLAQNATTEVLRYPDGSEVELSERGVSDIAIGPSNVRLSVPFRNVGTGVALVIGAWARTGDNESKVTGGPSVGIVGPGELARPILSAGLYEPMAEAVKGGAVVFGVQYTDAEGEQGMISETEVRRRADGSWTPGRTFLFRTDDSYPDKPFAFGGW
jgi:hypothetical protein